MKTTPLISPLTVFHELIFGINFDPPNILPPINEKVSNNQIVNTISIRKNTGYFSVINKNKNEKNESIIKVR